MFPKAEIGYFARVPTAVVDRGRCDPKNIISWVIEDKDKNGLCTIHNCSTEWSSPEQIHTDCLNTFIKYTF
jgi:hypothetical protein